MASSRNCLLFFSAESSCINSPRPPALQFFFSSSSYLPSLRCRSSSITGRQYETSIAHRGVENCVPSFGDVPGGIFDGFHDFSSSFH